MRIRFAALALLAAIVVLLLGPALVARYPPVLDLAQQSAQIRLLERAWNDPSGPYEIRWRGPNKLSYPLLGLGMVVGGATWGPRIGLLACELVFVGSILLLAVRLGRPLEHAALATVFVYNSALYGGFFNFLVGSLGFGLWLIELSRWRRSEQDPLWTRWALLRLVLVGLVLYWCHLLWIVAAGFVAAFVGTRRRSWRSTWITLVALAPFVLAGGFWYASAGESDRRWGALINYQSSLVERLFGLDLWSSWTLGGLKGPWEGALLVLVLLWVWLCLRTTRKEGTLRGEADPWLARIALVLAILSFLLPDGVGDTALLSRRWAPWAAILALLALPAPHVRRRWRTLAVGVLILAQAAATARAWKGFSEEEMRGFSPAIAAVPEGTRLLALDLDRSSPRIWIYPYFQMAAYAQLDRNVTLGYSFASTPSSLVVFRGSQDWPWPWSRGLEHHPELLRPEDLDFFDFVLVHARPSAQRLVAERISRLYEVAGDGPWRLYRVTPGDALVPTMDIGGAEAPGS